MINNPRIGPFFFIDNKLYANKCSLDKADSQADKLDNPYGHDRLYDDCFSDGDYIDYPRGRVVWDCSNNRGIIYIDPCINKPEIIELLIKEYELIDYTVEGDIHYQCRNCLCDIWEE